MTGLLRTYAVAVLALGLALLSGLGASLLSVPVPWLLGAVVGSLAMGFTRRRPGFPTPVRDVAFILLGYLIGSTASSDFFSSVSLWVPSVAASLLLIPAITFGSALVIHRLTDLTADEAMLCSVPGSLPFVVAASEDLGLRSHIVVSFQSVRLLALTFILPFALSAFPVLPDAQAITAAITPTWGERMLGAFWTGEALTMTASLGFALACAVGAGRLSIPAPTFIGPMMGVAFAKLAGLPLPDLPLLLLFWAQAALGWIMGSRFDAISFAELRRLAVACLAGLSVGVGVAVLACVVLAWSTGLEFRALVLALAPGAIETVTSVALAQNVDPLFVSTHQIARMLSIPMLVAGLLLVGRRLFAWLQPRT